MLKRLCCFAAAALIAAVVSVRTHASATDTRLLSQPAVSATHVAFVYAGDLWSATLAGSDVRRLTTSQGEITSPGFSPDRAPIAFSADFDANTNGHIVGTDGVPGSRR